MLSRSRARSFHRERAFSGSWCAGAYLVDAPPVCRARPAGLVGGSATLSRRLVACKPRLRPCPNAMRVAQVSWLRSMSARRHQLEPLARTS